MTRVLMTAWDGTRVLKAWNSPAEIKSYRKSFLHHHVNISSETHQA